MNIILTISLIFKILLYSFTAKYHPTMVLYLSKFFIGNWLNNLLTSFHEQFHFPLLLQILLCFYLFFLILFKDFYSSITDGKHLTEASTCYSNWCTINKKPLWILLKPSYLLLKYHCILLKQNITKNCFLIKGLLVSYLTEQYGCFFWHSWSF